MYAPSLGSTTDAALAEQRYPEQFATVSDPLAVLVPRPEILAAMLARGEQRVLDEVCLAVAIVADATQAAMDL